MISKRRFSLPRLDITGMWVFSLGVWFHIVARLVYSKPWMTGSLVFGPNGEITPLSARTTDRSIIRAMMEGGTAKIYHCNDSDKCLKVVADTPVTISRDNALKSQITKLLASIQNKAVSDTPLDDKEKGFISSTTIPVFKYLVDPQMLGVSNSMIYQLTDYIGYDILLQYIQELIQQARAMVATGNYDEAVIEHINDNMNDATRQIAAFQSQVQVQQDALLVVDRQMSYMRQQLSARMLSRYQNNYHCRVSFHDDPAIILDDGQGTRGRIFQCVQPFRFLCYQPDCQCGR